MNFGILDKVTKEFYKFKLEDLVETPTWFDGKAITKEVLADANSEKKRYVLSTGSGEKDWFGTEIFTGQKIRCSISGHTEEHEVTLHKGGFYLDNNLARPLYSAFEAFRRIEIVKESEKFMGVRTFGYDSLLKVAETVEDGDYVKGVESFGTQLREIYGWVYGAKKPQPDGFWYCDIQADDEFHGARGTMISNKEYPIYFIDRRENLYK